MFLSGGILLLYLFCKKKKSYFYKQRRDIEYQNKTQTKDFYSEVH